MPQASAGAAKKYAWQDHDPEVLNQTPVVQNTWYIVAHIYDFRELLFSIEYADEESNQFDYEARWTIDGHIYTTTGTAAAEAQIYLMKNKYNSTEAMNHLTERVFTTGDFNYDDKRGLDGLFEVRQTHAVGTDPILIAHLLYETLEET